MIQVVAEATEHVSNVVRKATCPENVPKGAVVAEAAELVSNVVRKATCPENVPKVVVAEVSRFTHTVW